MGSEAWSEVENRNLRHFLTPRSGEVKFFNTLHSYGQVDISLLTPGKVESLKSCFGGEGKLIICMKLIILVTFIIFSGKYRAMRTFLMFVVAPA